MTYTSILQISDRLFQCPPRHTIGDNNGGKGGAITESTPFNTRHTIGDNNGGKGRALIESETSNIRHTLGDNNGGKGGATRESSLFNTRHTIGDNAVLATADKCIGRCVDNRVALLSTIIHRITFCYDHGGKGFATFEN